MIVSSSLHHHHQHHHHCSSPVTLSVSIFHYTCCFFILSINTYIQIGMREAIILDCNTVIDSCWCTHTLSYYDKSFLVTYRAGDHIMMPSSSVATASRRITRRKQSSQNQHQRHFIITSNVNINILQLLFFCFILTTQVSQTVSQSLSWTHSTWSG